MSKISVTKNYWFRCLLEYLAAVMILLAAIVTFVFICFPTTFLRLIVNVFSKYFKSDLGRILSPCSSFLASDDLYNHPTCTLTPTYFVDGVISKQGFTKRMEQIVAKDNYAELTQTLTSWMGFYFWKKIENFDIKNHLIFNDDPVSEEHICQIQQQLMRKPYEKLKPVWEIILYRNFKSSKPSNIEEGVQRQTVVFGRFHHSLADGYALLNLLNDITEANFLSSVPQPKFQKNSFFQNVVFVLKLCTVGLVELAYSGLKLTYYSPWKVKPKDTNKTYVSADNDEFQFDDVIETAKIFGVSSTALIYSAYAGGTRNFMREMKVDIPDTFTTMFPLPVPGIAHSGCLTNHMTVVPVEAPLKTPNAFKRLYETHAIFEKLKHSTIPYAYYLVMNVAFPILSLMVKHFPLASAQLTNFPGPRDRPTFQSLPVTHFNFSTGLCLAFTCTEFTAHTFSGRLHLKVIFDTCLYNDTSMAQQYIQLIANEFKILINAAQLLKTNGK